MSTWQATPRGLALAAHIRNEYHQLPCPPDCPICEEPRPPLAASAHPTATHG